MIGIFSFTAIIYLDRSGFIHELDPRLSSDQWGFCLMPVLFAGLMVLFHVMERKTAKKREGSAQQGMQPMAEERATADAWPFVG